MMGLLEQMIKTANTRRITHPGGEEFIMPRDGGRRRETEFYDHAGKLKHKSLQERIGLLEQLLMHGTNLKNLGPRYKEEKQYGNPNAFRSALNTTVNEMRNIHTDDNLKWKDLHSANADDFK